MIWYSAIAICLILFLNNSAKKRKLFDQRLERLDRLEIRIAKLEIFFKTGEKTDVSVVPEKVSMALEAITESEVKPIPAIVSKQDSVEQQLSSEPATNETVPQEPESQQQTFPESEFVLSLRNGWNRIEQALIENWTGILGSVVVVVGITFIGIYTALGLAPVYRFMMMAGVAAAMIAGSVFLSRNETWRAFAKWIRSIGAAVLLFACAASGGLPNFGLQWIEQAMPALAFLLLGIAANLYVAWTVREQMFASLHVLLSLLPLAIVPQSATSFCVALTVTLFGIALSLKTRWDKHLLAVICAYFVYNVSHFPRLESVVSPDIELVGRLGAIVVFLAAAAIHYRKDYASQNLEDWPLIVHISNWIFLAASLFLYQLDSPMQRSVALAAAAIAAYFFARRARPLGIRWLYLCDTLIAEIIAIAAVISLSSIIPSVQLILLAILLEATLFLRLMIDEGEILLKRIGWWLVNIVSLLFAYQGVAMFVAEQSASVQDILILFAGTALVLISGLHLGRKLEKNFVATDDVLLSPTMGWLVGAIVSVGLLNLTKTHFMEIIALLSLSGLFAICRSKSKTASLPGLLAGTGVAVVAAHLMSWSTMFLHMPWEAANLAWHITPLCTLSLVTIWLGSNETLRKIAIYLLGLNAALAAYLFFNPISPLIPGVVWLLMSLVALEISNRLRARLGAIPALSMGYFYLALFVAVYALVIIQSPAYVGVISLRLLIELFGFGVIVYWLLYRPNQQMASEGLWLRVHPFFVELGLIAVAVINFVEVAAQWQSVVWSSLGIAMLTKPVAQVDKRFRTYSIIFYLTSMADVAVTMSSFESPSSNWYDRPEITSLIAIALQILFIVMSRARLALTGAAFPNVFPSGLGALNTFEDAVSKRRNSWTYYPFFVSVALFLFWRFDHSALTLLWTAEAFVIFALSAVLRENQFRYLALIALGICLIRLLFVDMVEANLGLRGLVFLGVGSLMLGMNAVYNRYRARFQ